MPVNPYTFFRGSTLEYLNRYRIGWFRINLEEYEFLPGTWWIGCMSYRECIDCGCWVAFSAIHLPCDEHWYQPKETA